MNLIGLSSMVNAAFLIIIFGFVTTIILVSFFRTVAYRYHLLDVPNARSSHELPMPRSGGVGIVLSFLTGVTLLYFLKIIDLNLFVAFLVGGIMLACVGLLDDLMHVPVRIRIFFHFIAAILVLHLFKGMPALDLGFWIWHWEVIGVVIGLLGLVWLINLYNFMDGIDGLAGTEAIFVTMSVALLLLLKGNMSYIPIFLLLSACVAGFLVWNWPPAKVFMGDTGSGFLGYTFGVLLIATISNASLTPWQWLILFGCFWIDATLTLLLRVIRGEPWYQAHCSHAFQQAVKKTGCHKQVVLRVLSINLLWLLPLAILSVIFPKWALPLTIVAISPLIALCVMLKAGLSHKPNNAPVLNPITE